MIPREEWKRAGPHASQACSRRGVLPFLFADPGAFWDDTVKYGAGTYRIVGYGLSAILVRLGILDDRDGSYPFALIALLTWVPLTVWLLYAQRRSRELWVGRRGVRHLDPVADVHRPDLQQLLPRLADDGRARGGAHGARVASCSSTRVTRHAARSSCPASATSARRRCSGSPARRRRRDGWSVVEVDERAPADRRSRSSGCAGRPSGRSTPRAAPRTVVVIGKSLGSVAATLHQRSRRLAHAAPDPAGDRGGDRVGHERAHAARGQSRTTRPGAAAPCRTTRCSSVLELPGLDHSLQVSGVPSASLDVLRTSPLAFLLGSLRAQVRP